jgi:putative transposase
MGTEQGHPLGVTDMPEPRSARQTINDMLDAGLFDELMDRVDAGELTLTGQGGFLPEMVKAVLERGLAAELTEHLGYERGDPAGRGSPNSRNGSTPKTLATEVGPVPLDTPRDRRGSFEPRLVPKGARRAGGLDEMIVSLYAGGMTVRDIQHHLARTLGTELSHDTISTITDAVLDEVKAWQTRPLEELYPILYLDALVIKVRDGHQVRNKAAHIAVGVDLDGIKHVLGIWVQASEGAKFWAGVCAELRNRGIRDVLIVCCDGLTGFPEAIEATWPHSIVQTCTVHLIRAAMRFVSYQDRKKVAAALRPIYTAPTIDAAESELLAFADSPLGRRYPATVATWENAWQRITGVPGLPARAAPHHLHHQRRGEPELPAPEDHQESGALPERRRRDQAAVAGHPRHRRQTRPSSREGEGPAADPAHRAGPTGRRRHRAGLESRPRRPRAGLPRPPRRLPHLTAFPPSWPFLPAAPEESTWSARSAARTNDVDTDKRWKTINSGGNQHH